MRQFLTWAESIVRLNTDSESLRQALQFGQWRDLRVYLRTDARAYVATMTGEGIALGEFNEAMELEYLGPQWNSNEPVHLVDGRTLLARGGDDLFCSWEKQDTPQSVTGYPAVYLLNGFLRVFPRLVRRYVEEGYIDGLAVSPPSWWESDESPVPLDEAGQPRVYFVVLNRGDTGRYQSPPRDLEELWFSAQDIEKLAITLARQTEQPMERLEKAKPPKLRSDREQNLLRVIAAMWKLSGLPMEHNTTADKLSALMDGWGWDKPAAGTIADTILKEAANLPGANIRS